MIPEAALAAALLASTASPTGSPGEYLGSAVCAGCHATLAKSYAAHPMARSSGRLDQPGAPRVKAAAFTHAPSGVRYSVRPRAEGPLLVEFERASPEAPLKGSIDVPYFTGGKKGLSFVYLRDGALYQAPVSYYVDGDRWDVSPGYEDQPYMTLSRPAQARCVECHASGSRSVPGTVNRFDGEPFREGGIACERCHGPGSAHRDRILGGGTGGLAIVNPARLTPDRRDSVCAQCHLRAQAQVQKQGCGLAEFRPGDALADVAPSFVWAGEARALDATSHYEKLWQSTCHQKAGNRLWCVSCHDPHRPVAETERARHFRARCLQCHQDASCKAAQAQRAARGDDCVACHMPKRRNESIAHAVATDHTIPRFADAAPLRSVPPPAERELVPFWGGTPAVRDLGLAYASLVKDRDAYRSRAQELLQRAYGEGARDAQTVILLGTFLEAAGAPAQALPLYQAALAGGGGCADELSVAENRLGALLAARGRVGDALRFFEQALFRAPVYEAARLNLSRARAVSGLRPEAEQALGQALELEPDSPVLRQAVAELRRRLEP